MVSDTETATMAARRNRQGRPRQRRLRQGAQRGRVPQERARQERAQQERARQERARQERARQGAQQERAQQERARQIRARQERAEQRIARQRAGEEHITNNATLTLPLCEMLENIDYSGGDIPRLCQHYDDFVNLITMFDQLLAQNKVSMGYVQRRRIVWALMVAVAQRLGYGEDTDMYQIMTNCLTVEQAHGFFWNQLLDPYAMIAKVYWLRRQNEFKFDNYHHIVNIPSSFSAVALFSDWDATKEFCKLELDLLKEAHVPWYCLNPRTSIENLDNWRAVPQQGAGDFVENPCPYVARTPYEEKRLADVISKLNLPWRVDDLAATSTPLECSEYYDRAIDYKETLRRVVKVFLRLKDLLNEVETCTIGRAIEETLHVWFRADWPESNAARELFECQTWADYDKWFMIFMMPLLAIMGKIYVVSNQWHTVDSCLEAQAKVPFLANHCCLLWDISRMFPWEEASTEGTIIVANWRDQLENWWKPRTPENLPLLLMDVDQLWGVKLGQDPGPIRELQPPYNRITHLP